VSQNHWVLAVIQFRERKIVYFDSLGDSGRIVLSNLLNFLQDEHMNKKKEPLFGGEKWILIDSFKECPQQRNYYDCGVFMLIRAQYLATRNAPNYTHKDMPLFRQKICLAILENRIV
jgi:sentrin-specific protease 1